MQVQFIPGSGRSLGGGHGNPLQYSCLENSQGHNSLASYNPQGHKESDKTEQLSISTGVAKILKSLTVPLVVKEM